jgi:hypothetical protein
MRSQMGRHRRMRRMMLMRSCIVFFDGGRAMAARVQVEGGIGDVSDSRGS